MKRLFAGLIAVLALGSAAQAGSCGYANCWGAVGIGPHGAAGYSFNYSSENGALNRMYAECPSCNSTYTFVNACGAIAQAADGAWGSGWGDTRELAEYYATQTCAQYTRSGGCRTAVWACSR
ncbi:DUF4189 domain-containing protein [Maliponia aquimaris]|uniref:DUF4189 domain-containing protein n=1 Tax=Maliponia aquimaris TaxID=1673631 RepID=A0A238JRC7_9RHOB|nr:DUF4189 domain-containing protein [Maliponia aquimaris]SMX33238.1 hypothetical protein MAA8898_00425 [Maliponia aquimaris]